MKGSLVLVNYGMNEAFHVCKNEILDENEGCKSVWEITPFR